jgi:hypothetical protein
LKLIWTRSNTSINYVFGHQIIQTQIWNYRLGKKEDPAGIWQVSILLGFEKYTCVYLTEKPNWNCKPKLGLRYKKRKCFDGYIIKLRMLFTRHIWWWYTITQYWICNKFPSNSNFHPIPISIQNQPKFPINVRRLSLLSKYFFNLPGHLTGPC